MDHASAIGIAPSPPARKVAARAALIGMPDERGGLLQDCFRQFGIEPVIMNGNAADQLRKEKFAACVVRLGKEAEGVMESIRSSPSNSRIIVYALGGTAKDALRYSKYGVNAIFQEPVERPAALKLVRATQMLVHHEFRRYVRIPIITEVSLVTSDTRRFTATSHDVSSGGMSLESTQEVAPGQSLEITFALLTLPRIWVRGNVSWRKGQRFGVRFDPKDDRRGKIKEWVDAYLEA